MKRSNKQLIVNLLVIVVSLIVGLFIYWGPYGPRQYAKQHCVEAQITEQTP